MGEDLRLGAHVSIAGGVSNAIEREKEVGGNCGQIFASSPRAWAVKDPPGDEIERFRELREEEDQRPYAIHSKYLINLGSHNQEARKRSLDALQAELDIASSLGIEYVVFHPGAHTGGIDRKTGIENVSGCLSSLDIPDGVKLLLENTSGRGTTLGRTFEELGDMIGGSEHGYEKLGVCFDTCHGFCAGYPIHEPKGLGFTIQSLKDEVGLRNLCLIHLNDSKHPFDSRMDEHQHIGMGHIGEEAFSRLLTNEDIGKVPMVLETPVSAGRGYSWNISKVKELRGTTPH